MARIGGRNTALAWFAGISSLAIVLGLVWLAVPMAPVVVGWGMQITENALTPAPPAVSAAAPVSPTPFAPGSPPPSPAEPPTACEQMYPPALWDQLRSAAGTELDESVPFPPTSVAGLPEAFGARPRLGCEWTNAAGSATVTLADVSDAAPDAAMRVLSAVGFTCTALADGARCERGAGEQSMGESHVLRAGLWLSVVRSFPGPPFDQGSVEARVWP